MPRFPGKQRPHCPRNLLKMTYADQDGASVPRLVSFERCSELSGRPSEDFSGSDKFQWQIQDLRSAELPRCPTRCLFIWRVALSLGTMLHERGFDAGAGKTLVNKCAAMTGTDCIALKRAGGPLDASQSAVEICDIACVLILAGGVRRTLPDATKVVILGTQVGHRLGANVSDEIREGVRVRSYEQIKLYLAQVGVDSGLVEIIDANYERSRKTVLSRADLDRLRIVTSP